MARAMIDSGIEWIGEIPETWNRIRFKYLHNGLNTGEAIDKQLWSADESDTVFYTAGLTPIRTKYSDFPEWKYTRENDILLARNGTPYVYFPAVGACYTDHIIRAAMKDNINKRFVQYGLQQSIGAVVVDSVSIATWSASLWNEQVLPWPSAIEQKKIVDFLDKKCAEVDSVIAETEKTIAEYKYLKQSIITEAVTKGVCGKRSLKDSGSNWFGMIPSDWEMRRVKYVFNIRKDIAGKEGFTVLSITQRGITPKNIASNEGQLAENYSNYQFLHPGQFAMNHMDLLTGWVDISKYDGVTSPDYRVFELLNDTDYDPEYYLFLMQMCYTNRIFYGLGQGVSGMGRWRLQADKFLNFSIPIPSYQEQREIAAYLKERCAEMESLISAKQKLLEELAAYKKSVIYEYITGKKEVPACQ